MVGYRTAVVVEHRQDALTIQIGTLCQSPERRTRSLGIASGGFFGDKLLVVTQLTSSPA